jgi:hypothetical protein
MNGAVGRVSGDLCTQPWPWKKRDRIPAHPRGGAGRSFGLPTAVCLFLGTAGGKPTGARLELLRGARVVCNAQCLGVPQPAAERSHPSIYDQTPLSTLNYSRFCICCSISFS